MLKLLSVVAVLCMSLPLRTEAQDMAVAQKWADAKVVRYRVVGVHRGRVPVVSGDYEGKADVTDRITVEFVWDARQSKVRGNVTILDSKTEVANLKSDGTNCPPPTLNAAYEHFQSVSNSADGELIEIKGTRTYPAASVSNYPGSCSMRSVPGAAAAAVVHVAVIGAEVLAMPNMPGSPATIAADRKSFTLEGADNWIWTYTPVRVE